VVAERLIFEPGFSTASALSHEAGRGIGLDAALSAIKEFGGNLEVASEPGSGTTFFVSLPAF
jgi:chemotaxis protein histidine kinase CheA